jgi:hypothetical protein
MATREYSNNGRDAGSWGQRQEAEHLPLEASTKQQQWLWTLVCVSVYINCIKEYNKSNHQLKTHL